MPNEAYCSRALRLILLEIQLNKMSLFITSVRMPEPVRIKDNACSQSCRSETQRSAQNALILIHKAFF